ncbi:MAG TPA: TonB-dependent receptor [Chitinophagaceae bacterium]|nr:TonB-dependent receptor [Chitinophagaceae bacterium]HMU58147.1 TonB-dependent receptor [Chitinophagaceae bacterium]
MRKIALLTALLYLCAPVFSQTDTIAEKNLEEVIVFSGKFAEKKKNIVQKIDIIRAATIAKFNAQNTGDLFINTGNVFVQKSQQGGSSPVIRGFEASRVLIVIDGIRHNNAIFRAGHLQNVITIDQNMLEQAEVLYGPSSTLYGSDALGGIMHLRTKSPKLSATNKLLVSGSAFSRLSSANDEKTIHYDLSLGGKKLAWLSAFTFSNFDDMKMGSNYPDKYPAFGRRDSVIAFFGFKDSVIANPDKQVQRYSGYKQWDVMQKLLFQQNEKVSHTLNFQYSSTNDVPRYDRLQDKRNFGGSIGNTLRYAQWYYGPQKRILGAYELNIKSLGLFDELRANINYQNLEESRQQREYRRYDRFDSRREEVNVWGFVIDGRKKFGNNELTVGIDGQFNDVKSRADRTNLNTGAVSKLDTRYPDGKNKMNYIALYGQHILKIAGGKWVLNDGIRFQSVSLKSNVIDNSFFNLPVTNFKQNNFAVTGNLGLIYLPHERTRVAFGLSSGFRSPNIDDLVKVFDFSVAKRVYVPNTDVKPEYTYNADLTISQRFAKIFRLELTGFYTLFDNAIVGAPFKLNGQDSILYNSVMSAVYANQNMNKGYTYGFSANVKIDFAKSLSFFSTASLTKGELEKFNGTKVPQDHIPPFFGKTSLNYQHPKFNTELYAMYNGWKKIENYNPDGEDNQQYATADGMPSWLTLNWRGNVTLSKAVQLQVAVENILDRNYRYFGSGFSAPGRNFIVALRANW